MASHYCEDHDPITVASTLTCGDCKAVSWPVDAEWLTDSLMLAAYESVHKPSCPRPHDYGTVLLDYDGDDTLTYAGRPDKDPMCTAITTEGRRCRNYVFIDGLCGTHVARRQRARRRTS